LIINPIFYLHTLFFSIICTACHPLFSRLEAMNRRWHLQGSFSAQIRAAISSLAIPLRYYMAAILVVKMRAEKFSQLVRAIELP
jgi:hypothetical protein